MRPKGRWLLGAQDFSKRVDFEAIETTIKAEAMDFSASVLEVFLNKDTSDHTEDLLPCPCGCMAHYRGVGSRQLATVVGNIEYERAYYHCKQCGHGFYPKDQAMGLDSSGVSPGVVRMIGQSAARESFAYPVRRSKQGVRCHRRSLEAQRNALEQGGSKQNCGASIVRNQQPV